MWPLKLFLTRIMRLKIYRLIVIDFGQYDMNVTNLYGPKSAFLESVIIFPLLSLFVAGVEPAL